jgi:hypothetical protein
MQYVCLIYSDRQRLESLPRSEYDAILAEYLEYIDTIKRSGHYLGGEALQPVRTAKTLRMRNGALSTTDGPFAETREQLGGFFLINARDLNDAIQVAARIPGARWGSIEVRPIMPTDRSGPGRPVR